jgi:hypothetical protein
LECSLYKNSEGKAEIHCIVGDEINLYNLFVEQQIIRDGIKVLFIISKINSTEIKCNMTNEDNEDANIVTSIFHNEESPSEETNGEERSNESKEESPDNNNSNGTMPNNNPPMPHTLPLNEYITDSIDDTTHKINESNIIKTENKNNSELNIELNETNTYNQSTLTDCTRNISTFQILPITNPVFFVIMDNLLALQISHNPNRNLYHMANPYQLEEVYYSFSINSSSIISSLSSPNGE